VLVFELGEWQVGFKLMRLNEYDSKIELNLLLSGEGEESLILILKSPVKMIWS
jgi:hypothetical protein